MVTLNEYQAKARTTSSYPHEEDIGIIYTALGLAGESGETVDKIKKVIRRRGVFDEETCTAIAMELGDVLWYVSMLSFELGFTLEQLAQMNLDKLADRKERGVIQGEGDNR